jgi:hypothetical protein
MAVDTTRALTGSHVATRYKSEPSTPSPAARKIARNAPRHPQLVATGCPLTLPAGGIAAGPLMPAAVAVPASPLPQRQNARTAETHDASVPSSAVLYGVQGTRPPDLVRNTIR